MTDQNAAVISCAERLFPLAALYLGSLSGGRAAVTETIAAVRRKSPDAWEDEVLPRLLRLPPRPPRPLLPQRGERL